MWECFIYFIPLRFHLILFDNVDTINLGSVAKHEIFCCQLCPPEWGGGGKSLEKWQHKLTFMSLEWQSWRWWRGMTPRYATKTTSQQPTPLDAILGRVWGQQQRQWQHYVTFAVRIICIDVHFSPIIIQLHSDMRYYHKKFNNPNLLVSCPNCSILYDTNVMFIWTDLVTVQCTMGKCTFVGWPIQLHNLAIILLFGKTFFCQYHP